MINETTRSGVLNRNQMLVLIYSVIVGCMVSGYRGVANYVAFGSMLALIVVWLISNNWCISGTKELGFYIWFVLYYIMTSLLKIDVSYFVTYTAYNILMLFPVLMWLILEKSKDVGFIIASVKVTLVLWFFIAVYTAVFYLVNPQAARLAASSQAFDDATVMGGYQFAYGSSLLGVYLFSLLFDKRITDRFRRFWVFIGVVVLAVVTYLTESTLTTFSLILGVVMVLIFDRDRETKKTSGRRVVMVVVLLSIVVAAYYAMASNAERIAAWLDQRYDVLFFRRVGELFDATFLDQQTGHYNKRVGLIEMSWNTFLKNPVFGVGYKFGNIFSQSRASGIGNHSEIMDVLARYGVVGATPIFALYYHSFKRIRGSHVGVLSAFALMMFCNPFMSFHSHLVLFVLIPSMEMIIGSKGEAEKKSASDKIEKV